MTVNSSSCSKLSTLALGFAFGLTNGLGMMLLAWVTAIWGFGLDMVHQVANLYVGYAPTFWGGIVGGFWGLIDGFIFGFILAFFYNCCLNCAVCRSICGFNKSIEKKKKSHRKV